MTKNPLVQCAIACALHFLIHWQICNSILKIKLVWQKQFKPRYSPVASMLNWKDAANSKSWTTYFICSCVPPDVALDIAHAASFLMSNSAVASKATRGGMMLASIIAWKKNNKYLWDCRSKTPQCQFECNDCVSPTKTTQTQQETAGCDLLSSKKSIRPSPSWWMAVPSCHYSLLISWMSNWGFR